MGNFSPHCRKNNTLSLLFGGRVLTACIIDSPLVLHCLFSPTSLTHSRERWAMWENDNFPTHTHTAEIENFPILNKFISLWQRWGERANTEAHGKKHTVGSEKQRKYRSMKILSSTCVSSVIDRRWYRSDSLVAVEFYCYVLHPWIIASWLGRREKLHKNWNVSRVRLQRRQCTLAHTFEWENCKLNSENGRDCRQWDKVSELQVEMSNYNSDD